MRAIWIRTASVILLCSSVVGCSTENDTPAGASNPDVDSVTGVVTKIEDYVPVDGGVSIELKLDNGQTDTAFLPSFFTAPPPPQEQYEIYEMIRELEIGDRITVEGQRTSKGIKIEQLTVASG
jgi:hypothetical protein